MSYAVRNTLIIAAFWALVLGGGYFYYHGHQNKVIAKLQADKEKKNERLDELKMYEKQLVQSYSYYNHLQEINSGKNGIIASNESPGETYDYILREIKKSGLALELNLTYEKEDSVSNVLRRIYSIEGLGRFVDVYKLLWFLENGPVFYGINNLNMDRATAEEKAKSPVQGNTKFSLTLESFNRQDGPKLADIVRHEGKPKDLAQLVQVKFIKLANSSVAPVKRSKPKTTRVRPSLRRMNPSGLPVVSAQTTIMAITPNSILIKDSRGKLIKLRKGDQVYGGYLKEINTAYDQAIFEINNGNGSRKLVLNVTSK